MIPLSLCEMLIAVEQAVFILLKFTLKLTSYVKGDSAYTITVDTYIQPHKIYKSKVPVHP